MKVKGLGYWIGAGLSAAGLVGILLWVSIVSARPGTQVVVPDPAAGAAAGAAADDSPQPVGRSEPAQERSRPEPVGLDSTLSRLQSRPVTGPATARDRAGEQAAEKAEAISAGADGDGDTESSSRILRVETDGTDSEVRPPDNTPAAGDDADPGTSSTVQPPAGTTAKTGREGPGGNSDSGGPVNDPDTPPPGHSERGAKATAGNGRTATSTTAHARKPSTTTTTARPSTESMAEETTIKDPITDTTAGTTTRPPTTAKPITTEGTGGGGNQAAEQRVIELTNDARRQAGCPALVHNDTLRLAAFLHSKDMSDNDFFKHTGLDGSSPGDRILRQGYEFRTWAENIAWGYRTPEAVVEGWMNSAGHRANILNCSLTEIGVGFHNYYWTQNFGVPR